MYSATSLSTPDNCTVSISMRQIGRDVEILFVDTGEGVSDEMLIQLLNHFGAQGRVGTNDSGTVGWGWGCHLYNRPFMHTEVKLLCHTINSGLSWHQTSSIWNSEQTSRVSVKCSRFDNASFHCLGIDCIPYRTYLPRDGTHRICVMTQIHSFD